MLVNIVTCETLNLSRYLIIEMYRVGWEFPD